MSVSLISHSLKLAIKIIHRPTMHTRKHVAIDIHCDPNVAMSRELLLIDKSLTTYDPAFIRGRARLLAQKAEAYHGLSFIDESVAIAEELQQAVAQGRIQEKDIAAAAKTWDTCLGATYMRDQAIEMGVPPEAIFVEQEALSTFYHSTIPGEDQFLGHQE